MKIENKSIAAHVLPAGGKGKMVEIAPGASAEIDDKTWASLKKRASISAKIEAGHLVEAKPEKPAKAEKKD